MPKVKCPQGHVLNVSDEKLGRKAKCPKCQSVFVLKVDAPDDDLDDCYEQPSRPVERRQPLGNRSKPSARKPRAPRERRSIPWKIILPIFAVFLVIGSFVGMLVHFGSSEGRSDRDAGVAQENLATLGRAMKEYHERYGMFPSAVLLGPDGKTPYSWRVALLPYLREKTLYEQYRQDEPWDSPANKKVLDQMPVVYRSPYDGPRTTNSGYYAVAGPGTAIEPKTGFNARDILDGPQNTLLVVESKQDIPWTQPEDISFDPSQPPPKLGGYMGDKFAFLAADFRVYTVSPSQLQGGRWNSLLLRGDRSMFDLELACSPPPVPTDEREHSEYNLTMLGRAMMTFLDRHGHFPPAVGAGPDGKTPHSWRVALLPCIGQEALYAQYQLNEPWDSEANKKVLAQMPALLHNPYDTAGSTNSGYFVVSGPGAIFDGNQTFKLSDIKDGLSSTLLLTEAKRDIPWTKPEDIVYSPDTSDPEIGGFDRDKCSLITVDQKIHTVGKDKIAADLEGWILRQDDFLLSRQVKRSIPVGP